MKTLDIFVNLVICGIIVVSKQQSDCPYQECHCFDTTIRCQNKSLTVFPHLRNVSAMGFLTLGLDDNHITTIPANSFPPGLTELSLINNPITTIDDAAFDVLSSTLQTLYFSEARFTRIPDALIRLDVLQRLNIYNMPIEDWNPTVMEHIGQTLHTLSLGNDNFTSWPNWIQNFSSLYELNIPDSFIPSSPDFALGNLADTLSTLTLTNNSLTSVPETFSKLTSLGELDLRDNKITNVTSLPVSRNLMLIWLDNNEIFDAQELSTALNWSDNIVSTFSISNNKLLAIPSLSFMTNLNWLDLSHNLISDATSGSLPPDMHELDFSYNLLPSIPTVYKSVPSLAFIFLSNNAVRELREADIPLWVTELDLGFNRITALTNSSFPKGSSLDNLNLKNNPLSVISDHAFLELRSLSALNLQETQITRLPLSLVHLTDLVVLNLSNCSSLVCTCAEKSVGQNITAQTANIEGKCGEISIYDFFKNLSSNCP